MNNIHLFYSFPIIKQPTWCKSYRVAPWIPGFKCLVSGGSLLADLGRAKHTLMLGNLKVGFGDLELQQVSR